MSESTPSTPSTFEPKFVSEKTLHSSVKDILELLKQSGVKNIVCAPGGRCKALLEAFLDDKNFSVQTLYDERTAGFYALGLSFSEPTVVLTTSGTAVTELSSAMAEAYYQKDSKLIALTADRPLTLRHTGAPQSLNQFEVFKNFTRSFFDLICSEDQETKEKKSSHLKPNLKYPAHINVCLDEPNPINPSLKSPKKTSNDFGPLVVVSELNPWQKKEVKKEFSDYEGALVLEPLSNLSHKDFPGAITLDFSEPFILSKGLNSFSSLFRIGGVPVFKPWRSWHNSNKKETFKKYYCKEFSCFSGGEGVEGLSLSDIKQKTFKGPINENLKNEVKAYSKAFKDLMSSYPQSEVGLLNLLSKKINSEDQVFIGNSLTIRQWDFVENKNYEIFGQRGVNGIDGALAFALGKMNPKKKNWIVLGDLTTLYNFNDFQILEKIKKRHVNIVVVNNYGGQIFSRVIKTNPKPFLNSHKKNFKLLAEFWGLSYYQNEFDLKEGSNLLELIPNEKSSKEFLKNLEGL